MKLFPLLFLSFLGSFGSTAQTWKHYPVYGLVNNTVYTIAIDAQGNKWFGTFGGVSKFDGTNWTSYTVANTNGGLSRNNVSIIKIDKKGNSWFAKGISGSFAGFFGVSKFDGTNWVTYTPTNTNNGLQSVFISAIEEDAQGNLWFSYGQYANGVTKFDGTNWTTYTTANGLSSNKVYSILADANGNTWFGTSNGISKFDGSAWTTQHSNFGCLAKASAEGGSICLWDEGHG